VNPLRATVLLTLSIAVPVGFLASRPSVSCNTPAYEGVTARLVAMHGTVATYSALSSDFGGSAFRVGRHFDVRYDAGDSNELRVGETYRVESTGDGRDNAVSSLRSPCGPRTTFTDGSSVHARTWWQRNHVALGLVVAVSVALVVAAVWLRRRMWARGEIGRLAA
jgi:hypothetical protein